MSDSPTDIYAISARVKNAASKAVNTNLTPQGVMVCNSFITMFKTLYDYVNTMEDCDEKVQLMDLIREQEEAPARLITALCAGMKKKNEKSVG